MGCPIPEGTSKCPPIQVYQSQPGVQNVAFLLCDTANKEVLAVYEICNDGSVTGAPSYFDLTGAPVTPTLPLKQCGGGDVPYEVLCDLGTNPNLQIIAIFQNTVPPSLAYYTPGVTGALTPYTPIGPVSACPSEDIEDTQTCYIAINAGTGYAANDQIIQISFWGTGETPPVLRSVVWRNQTQGTILAAAPLAADLTSCGGSNDYEIAVLCDTSATGTITRFLRRYAINPQGNVSTLDTNLDGVTAYTPTGTVKNCGADGVESTTECFTAHAAGTGYAIGDRLIQYIQFDPQAVPPVVTANTWYNATTNTALAAAPNWIHLRPCGLDVEAVSFCYTAKVSNPNTAYNAGDQLRYTRYENVSEYSPAGPIYSIQSWFNVTQVRWIPTADVMITDLVTCTNGQIEIVCRCSDDDGDGVAEKSFRSIVSIDSQGVTTVLANYEPDLITPYTPVSPGTCSVPGDNLVAFIPRYTVLSGVGIWSLGADSVLPTTSVSFTVVTVGNVATPPTVTDAGGTHPLFASQAISWSTTNARDVAGLRPPLTLKTNTGDTVTVAWTTEVA